jgi:hypothetical protein
MNAKSVKNIAVAVLVGIVLSILLFVSGFITGAVWNRNRGLDKGTENKGDISGHRTEYDHIKSGLVGDGGLAGDIGDSVESGIDGVESGIDGLTGVGESLDSARGRADTILRLVGEGQDLMGEK